MTAAPKKMRISRSARSDKAVIQVRVDATIKSKAAKLFRRHGMSTSDGVRLLLDQAVRDDILPFDPDAPHTPNAATRKAIEECRKGGGKPVTREGLRKIWDEA